MWWDASSGEMLGENNKPHTGVSQRRSSQVVSRNDTTVRTDGKRKNGICLEPFPFANSISQSMRTDSVGAWMYIHGLDTMDSIGSIGSPRLGGLAVHEAYAR